MKKLILIIIGVLVLGGVGYYAVKKFQNPDETAGWKTYRNEQYGFDFKYPKEWVENSESSANVPLHISLGTSLKDMEKDGVWIALNIYDNKNKRPNYSSVAQTKKIGNISVQETTIRHDNGGTSVIFTFENGNAYYELVGSEWSFVPASEGMEEKARIVLSTFKFTK